RGMRVADAFREVVLAGLLHLLANQDCSAKGDMEGIHQLRVALRRLRSALVLFKPHLQPRATSRFDVELRRLAIILGEARDWDVFCVETLAAASPPSESCAAETSGWEHLLRTAAEGRRRQAHGAMVRELGGPSLTRLALEMAAWVEDGVATPALLGDQ